MTKEERQTRQTHLKRSASQVLLNSSLKLGTQGDYENDDVLGDNDIGDRSDTDEEKSHNNKQTNKKLQKNESPIEMQVTGEDMSKHPLFTGAVTRRTSFRDVSLSPSITNQKKVRNPSIGIPTSKINMRIAERKDLEQR